MPVRLYASQEFGTGLEKFTGEVVIITVETVSMTQTGHFGDNEYFYFRPHTYQRAGKLAEVTNYGLLVEGEGGYDKRIEYDDGFKQVAVPKGRSYFPFGESETYYEGSIMERASISERRVISVIHNGQTIYRQKPFLENPPANYYPRY